MTAQPTATILRAISDPGSILPRLLLGERGLEPLPEWQTRAVLHALETAGMHLRIPA